MDWLRESLQRFFALFRSAKLDGDLDAEMASHLEMAIEENRANGLSPQEARRQALLKFGGGTQARETHRESRSIAALENAWRDLRYTLRTLRKDRAFTLIAILILALGIGANIVVFSVVNTLLLRPLPFPNSRELVWFTMGHGIGGLSGITYNVSSWEEFRKQNRSFQEVTAFQTFWGSSEYTLIGQGQPQHVQGVMVADNFFSTLGVQPLLGRTFVPAETVKGGPPAIILSNAFWQRQFAADPSIVGTNVRLFEKSVTVVGVLPPSFDFPSVFAPSLNADIFLPAYMDELRNWGNTLAVFGRIKPGISIAQAQAEADILFPQLRAAHQEWFRAYDAEFSALKDYVSGRLRRSLFVLWGAVGLILLIVCVNLANLLLARMAARSKEFAMRSALGASRGRLIRQFLTESLVLSLGGAVLGVVFAYTATSYLAHQGSIALPLLSSVGVDGASLLWTVLITVVVGVLFGLAPGFAMSGEDVQNTLKESVRGTSQGKSHVNTRSILVISELALACVLLVGAGLLLRSFLRVLDVDLGFQPVRAAALAIDWDDGGKPERRAPILSEILERVKAQPGIESVGIADMLPLGRNRSWGFSNPAHAYNKGDDQSAIVRIVTPGYLGAMGIRLVEGRDFTWQDGTTSEKAVIINETAAKFHWPGQSPIGLKADGLDKGGTRVIGVVADARVTSMEEAPDAEIYYTATEADSEGSELVVRSNLPPDVLTRSVIPVLRQLNPDQPATAFRPIQSIVDHSVSPRRFFVLLVAIFAALGLILAALGIYGVISYSVTRQTQEIGIRMALGAMPRQVQYGVLGKTVRLALVGVLIGGVVAFAASKVIASLLFQTEPNDPLTFMGVLVVLLAVALLAGYLPALRATRISPTTALRFE
jgi:predicted permease